MVLICNDSKSIKLHYIITYWLATDVESIIKNSHNIQHTSLESWLARNKLSKDLISKDDLLDYYTTLKGEESFGEMCKIVAEEVFFILFMNRDLLRLFNEIIANIRCNSKYSSLKRSHMPKWVHRAVYFRDRGKCIICNCDLSGTTAISNIKNYDPIVPLNKNGLNDVSNIQLLCDLCNNRKKDKNSQINNSYERCYRVKSQVLTFTI